MPKYKTLINDIIESAKNYPDNIAVSMQNQNITYNDFINTASLWARKLLSLNKLPRLKYVAIFASRSSTAYIGTVASLLTGAAFIPINPQLTTVKNKLILKQSYPEVIIVEKRFINELYILSKECELSNIIFCPEFDEDITEYKGMRIYGAKSMLNENINLPSVTNDDYAYVLFTSGSTGEPKGVPISYKNVCSFIKYNQSQYNITPEDRFSQTFEQTFDLSIFDLFMAWCHGACVCVMRPIDLVSPAKYIIENRITIWFSVPSIVTLLKKQKFDIKNCFPSIRLSLFCGEPLLEENMYFWASAAPNSICENLYGPTELTIACSSYRWISGAKNLTYNEVVSIGKVYPHMEYAILDGDKLVMHKNGIGELCLRGSQMFKGYLNLDQATKKVFVLITNKTGVEELYYRTGDYVKLDGSGNLLFLGRQDQQIKINGYRVELGEIEFILRKYKGVENAVAFCAYEGCTERKVIAAYIVGKVKEESIFNYANNNLPPYMVPKFIQIENDFPLSPNGKIDRKLIRDKFKYI